MTNEQIAFQDVLQLVELIKASSNFSEVRLRLGDVEVELRRHGAAPVVPGSSGSAPVQQSVAAPLEKEVVAAPATAFKPALTAPASSRERPGHKAVHAPMVGTFYSAPEPGAPPFVKVGQKVAANDTVCIVEVMKLMNTISAGFNGVVAEILVADGQSVEPGQELFVIAPQ